MRSWARPTVPRLDGYGPVPRLYDTATGHVIETRQTPVLGIYVCGITPYDATHIGHAATYLAFDTLIRLWLDAGHDVHYVQNATDVDDPLLERATATGVAWEDLAADQVELFRTDMVALNVLPPDHYIGAVESIPLVVDLIGRLRAAGLVYPVDDATHPDLYFACSEAPGFLSESHLDVDAALAIFGERGGDPDRPGKRGPLDCLVWRLARDGEPSWPSELGRGRPGWHIECTAIALTYLGEHFDVQGGGSDLIFPHHEMCAAEGTAATGRPFASAYVHAGMVGYEGEKMSKSKGNLVLVSKLRAAGEDPMAIRLALLEHHYRDDWEWTAADLDAARVRLARWREAADRAAGAPASGVVAAVRAALRHDLDAPAALAAVDAWAASTGDDPTAPAELSRAVDALLGVRL